MTNVMVKTCLNHKIIKKSNLIQAMKNNVCAKATVTIRRPNFFENWICPKIHPMFRSVDWTHDMIVVKWREGTVIQYFRKPNLSEYLPNVPECSGVRIEPHDTVMVKWHLFIWHERTLGALTNAPPVQSSQTGQWLSTLFHDRRSCLCLVP